MDQDRFETQLTHETLLEEEIESVYYMIHAGRWQWSYDRDGNIDKVLLSNSYRKLLGIGEEEVLPTTLEAILRYTHPDDIPVLRDHLIAVRDNRDSKLGYDLDYRMICTNGEERWFHAVGHRIVNEGGKPAYAIGILTDVTEQKRVEFQRRMLEQLTGEYQTIWSINSVNGIMHLEKKGYSSETIDLIASAYEGVHYEKVMNLYADSYIVPEDRERIKQVANISYLLDHVTDGRVYTVNYVRKDLDGARHHLQGIYAKMFDEAGNVVFILGTRNIDSAIREEERKQQELEDARKAAEAANHAKTAFLFNMSHDIRTPMNAIIGYRDLLEKHQDDPEKRGHYLEQLEESSTVLLAIINNVLEMARIEKGTIEVDENAWGAEQFNDTLYSIFYGMMQTKGVNFTREIDVEHPYVYCDPMKLREVFLNLLSNAYKYTEPGGSVHMSLKEVPGEKEGYAYYQTTISDTGIGISQEYLPHLFEEFSKGRDTREALEDGSGLGMSIVKRLVEIMDGTIDVTSEEGVGTTFVVTLPHKIANRENLSEHEALDLDPELFAGKRILLAEDNEINAEIATEILEEAGFEVDHAEDGAVCVNRIQTSPTGYYDLVLMDIQMPNMNGYEAARAIRNLGNMEKAGIPILAMTANAFESDKREARKCGMNGHLSKPVNAKVLMRELARILKL